MMRLTALATLATSAAASKTIAIYTQPGATGSGIGDCSDEAMNLASIVQENINTDPFFSGFTIDSSLASFAQTNLVEILENADFFFMTDMERAAAGFDAAAQAALNAWVTDGGVMLMTGTYGSRDSDFMNAAFGWDTQSVSCSTASINSANAAGTPFAGGSATVSCPSATDHINCGSQACTAIYGSSSKAAVATFKHGRGTVVYVGYDYYNTGYATNWGLGTHSNCGARYQPYVTEILPAALKLAAEEAEAVANGDPHLSLPHGGKADFRGEDKTVYNFLSAKDFSLNVMTELADFELHAPDAPRHKKVHGSFLTQAHVVARTNEGKTVRTSFYADKIGNSNLGWANATVDDGAAFSIGPKATKEFGDVTLKMDYSSLTVWAPEFQIVISPKAFCKPGTFCGLRERNVTGAHHRLDIQIKKRVDESQLAVPPHGIVGQGWDGDAKAIDGEQDSFPASGEFTTYAMAKGAIEGTPNDYKVADKYATAFKFSRFDATTAEPRKVAELVASGNLNPPKKVLTATGDSVGASEYDFSNI